MKAYKFFLITIILVIMGNSCNSTITSKPVPMAQNTNLQKMTLGGQQLFIEKAVTAEQMAKGLSGRDSLPQDQGMLFDYQGKKLVPTFWMPDMNFDIDIIWLSDFKVVGIEHSVPALKVPKEQLPRYQPKVPVDMVLETNSGWASSHSIKIGDELRTSN